MSSHKPHHPIIVVTGANSGIGFGICHRLIVQFSCPSPPDALRGGSWTGPLSPSPFAPTKHLTLVLACRSAERANIARRRLLKFMDAEVSRQKKLTGYDGHAEELRRGLCIDYLPLDLANMSSIFDFAEKANRRYPYVTHLILNAGVLNMTAFDWNVVFKQLITEPVVAMTTPRFLIQPIGTESSDGFGLVWQSNVFGHYSLSRLMEPLLLLNPYRDSRIGWLSSLDAIPQDYDPADPQLRHAKFSYQASKYQIDLLCTALARTNVKKSSQEHQARITHILVHPGVCHSNMVVSVVGYFLVMAKFLCFYVVRFFGSYNHPIQPYKGAVAAVHACLAPATSLQESWDNAPHKLGSRSTTFGREYVGSDPVLEWEDNAKHASDLVQFCEKLFGTLVRAHGDSSSPTNTETTDSGFFTH